MADSVIRGFSITREAHYEDGGGSLVDPISPSVTIRDSLGVGIVTATPTRISLGIYQYTYNVQPADQLGGWQDEWQGTIGGQSYGPQIGYFTVLPVGAIVVVPSVAYTYNVATDPGRVRLLIDDRDMSSVDTSLPLEMRSAIFSDAEIQSFLDGKLGNVIRAAADALVTIANNRSLWVNKRTIGRTTVDFGTIKADYLKQAQMLIDMDSAIPADGIAEQVWNDFGLRGVIINTELRQEI